MATRSRTSIDGRLAELEQQRDRTITRMVDQYIAYMKELFTPDEWRMMHAAWDAGQDTPPDLEERIRADPRVRRLDHVYGRALYWRLNVGYHTNKTPPEL
jgi:hypothetical protein